MNLKKTYGELSISSTGDKWVLEKVAPHVVIKLKRMFPKIPQYKTKTFTLALKKDVAFDLEWFFSRYPFSMDDETRKKLKKLNRAYAKDSNASEDILLPNYIPKGRVGLKEGQQLRQYQRVAVDFGEQNKKILLIDEMGLGKTYEGLAMGLIPGRLPLVVVMEPHLQNQWAEKAEAFIDLKTHSVKGNTPYSLPEVDIYFLKYSQLSSWCDVFSRGWVKGIIFDEVQNLRTGEHSAKGKAASILCGTTDFVVGMTGTLIYNYGVEVWNIVNIMAKDTLGTLTEFEREWCQKDSSGKGIVQDPDALGSYLREIHMMLRRTREDVGQESKQLSPEKIEVAPDDQLVSDMEDLTSKLAMRVINASGRIEQRDANGEFDRRLRQMTGIAKAKATAAFVRMLVEEGNPVVLFGYHHEVYKIWAEELKDLNPAWYTGRETQSQKNKEYERFRNGETDIFIVSLLSGAGLDELQHRCRNIVFGEVDWSPKRHSQAIARLDRDGQLYSVYVYYIMSQFGSDPAMLELLGIKSEQSRGILDPNSIPEDKQSDPHRIYNMAENYLKRKGIKVDAPSESKIKTNEQLAIDL